MSKIQPYLVFNGNCREAMTFYRECLGGELIFQTVGDSPLSEKMSKRMKDVIVHATLTNGKLVIMGTDIVPETGLIKGNATALVLSAESENELDKWFQKLATGGKVSLTLQQTYLGALFGAVTDKFGNHWLFSYRKNDERTADQSAH